MCYKCKLHVDIRDEHHLFDILVLFPYLDQNGSHIVTTLWTCVSLMHHMFYWTYQLLLFVPLCARSPWVCWEHCG